MTHFSFRENHLLKILSQFEAQKGPLDLFLRNYFRAIKSIGSKDRKFISDAIYGMIRWKGLLDHFCKEKPTWEARYHIFQKNAPHFHLPDPTIPLHVRLSFPKSYFQTLVTSLGEERATQFCLASNQSAPTTVRVNLLKITRNELLKRWENMYEVSPSPVSPWGIVFHKKINFFGTEEFREGLFEVQDEGSQLVAALVCATPKQKVLDYCAGSGGKTLAFAPRMEHRGQIYLHDIRPHALQEAKKRLCRAGIQNAQLLFPEDLTKKKSLGGLMDWVLVDAPCSGSGTLRRNPDMKWKFDPSMIDALIAEQRTIFAEALSFLRKDGKIVYATCSVLPQENEEQVNFFMERHQLEMVTSPFCSSPLENCMDGFFAVVLKHK